MHTTILLTISAVITAFVLTYMFIPSIIKVANIKHLFDSPADRKSHYSAIPTLGGIGIFGGFLISFCLFAKFYLANEMRYIIAALCFVFMLGAKDDIVELVPSKKFIGQIFAACVIVILGDIRLTSMYGLLGITYLDYIPSIMLSMVTIIFIINAFNIIDGINLLAGSIGVLMFICFGTWFYFYGFYDYSILSAAMVGAIIAFLRYNYTPAQIFMGDSGSLSIGLLAGVLAIQFIEKNEIVLRSGSTIGIQIESAPAMAMAILIIPIYDTLRAFTLRVLRRRSPFQGDRIHIHHRLLDLGLSHINVTIVLITVNIVFIIIAYFLQSLGNLYLILVELALALALTLLIYLINGSRKSSMGKLNNKISMPVNMSSETARH
jgi:UDP-GlcNAc:undecaprenyl-phosphate/decaprenyl-phosphate GlcNAc-1-phosphate transferase